MLLYTILSYLLPAMFVYQKIIDQVMKNTKTVSRLLFPTYLLYPKNGINYCPEWDSTPSLHVFRRGVLFTTPSGTLHNGIAHITVN